MDLLVIVEIVRNIVHLRSGETALVVVYFILDHYCTIFVFLIISCCRRGRHIMVVGFTTTCAISAYHHSSFEFKPRSLRDVLDTTLCDKVCQCLATDRWFSQLPSPIKLAAML